MKEALSSRQIPSSSLYHVFSNLKHYKDKILFSVGEDPLMAGSSSRLIICPPRNSPLGRRETLEDGLQDECWRWEARKVDEKRRRERRDSQGLFIPLPFPPMDILL